MMARNNGTVEVVYEKNYPSRRLLAGLFMVPMLLLVSTLLLIPIMVINIDLATRMGIALPLTILAEVIAIYWVVKYAWEPGRWKDALYLYKPKVRHLFLGAGVGLLLFVGLQGVALGLDALGYGIESSDTSVSIGSLDGPERWLVLFLLSPIVVPIVEEIFFRGALLNSLRNSSIPGKWATPLAIVLSSILFALVHMQGFSTVSDFVLPVWIAGVAVVNAILMLKFKSVWVAAASHIAYNGITVVIVAITAAIS